MTKDGNTSKGENPKYPETHFSFTFSKEDGETVEKQTRKTSVCRKRINSLILRKRRQTSANKEDIRPKNKLFLNPVKKCQRQHQTSQ